MVVPVTAGIREEYDDMPVPTDLTSPDLIWYRSDTTN